MSAGKAGGFLSEAVSVVSDSYSWVPYTLTSIECNEVYQSDVRCEWVISPIKPLEILKEGYVMRTLFNVIVIDNEGEVLCNGNVVAKNREEALIKYGINNVLEDYGVEYDDVTIITNVLGDVKIKEKKKE